MRLAWAERASAALYGAFAFALATAVSASSLTAQQSGFRVQVAASGTPEAASELQEQLVRSLEFQVPVYVVSDGGMYKVRVGDFAARADAGPLVARVRDMGYEDAWVAADEIRVGVAGGGGGDPAVEDVRERLSSEAAQDRDPDVATIDANQAERDRQSRSLRLAAERLEAERNAAAQRDARRAEAQRAEEQRIAEAADRAEKQRIADEADRDRAEARDRDRDVPEADSEVRPAPDALPLDWPRVDNGAIELDGRLDEMAWARSLEGRVKGGSSARGRAPETMVRYAFDRQAFYVAAQVSHPDGAEMRASAMQDAPSDQERLVITVARDGAPALSFGVTLGGTRIDYVLDAPSSETAWSASAWVGRSEWAAEFQIPFELLDVESAGDEAWDVSVRWEDPKGLPTASRIPLPMQQFASVYEAGGISMLAVSPFIQTSTIRDTGPDGWGQPASRAGGELELEVGEALALHGQFQPDYSDSKPDPATVNLSPYETRFDETRPFFQRQHVGGGWGPSLFYSRRVGGVPGGAALPGGVESLLPTNVLGVGSVRGELAKTRFSFLTALSDLTRTSSTDALSGLPVAVDLSPQSWFGIARVERTGESGPIGLTVTSVARSIEEGSRLGDLLTDQAIAGAVDFDLALGREGSIAGFFGFSRVAGSPLAMAALQRGGAHYFQRPDADHLSLDAGATSMAGFTGGLSVSGGRDGARWSGRIRAESPGFNIQDAGFMRSADDIDGEVWMGWGRNVLAPENTAWQWGVDVGAAGHWNFGGTLLGVSPMAQLSGLVAGFDVRAALQYDLEGLSDELTRGGPLMATPSAWRSSVSLLRDGSSASLQVLVEVGADGLGGEWTHGRGRVGSRVTPALSFWVEPGFFTLVNPRQFALALPGGPAETFGQRYVFATLDQSELSTRFGIDIGFRRGFRLSGYAEPFLSSGRFSDFGELTRARENDLLVYGTEGTTATTDADGEILVDVGGSQFVIPASDFAIRSFRSHVALSWNWVPEGTVTLSWRQSRSAFENRYVSQGLASFQEALRDFGRNLLVLRLGYRLGWE